MIEKKKEEQNLTACGWLWTISTAFSLLKCSQSPSDANIRKESFGWRGWEMIVGLALKIGMFIGSGSLNFPLIGSSLYCTCFIYTSPIDLETCIKHNGEDCDHTFDFPLTHICQKIRERGNGDPNSIFRSNTLVYLNVSTNNISQSF